MKKILYIFMAAACIMFTGCIGGEDIGFDDDWNAPDGSNAPYGDNSIKEENVMSIAAFKEKYEKTITSNGYKLIDEDIKLKGIVTGNDIEGNIYSQIFIQDATGAITICIEQGGLFSYLPEGQEILVSLKDLYIGGYGTQPQIGTLYTNKNGNISVSRMNRVRWQKHFKLLGMKTPVEPEELDITKIGTLDSKKECGKLYTIKNISFRDANGVNIFAMDPETSNVGDAKTQKLLGGCINRNIKENYKFVVRTSQYADFAGMPLPQGKGSITGIMTIYNGTWQMLIRKYEDIKFPENN